MRQRQEGAARRTPPRQPAGDPAPAQGAEHRREPAERRVRPDGRPGMEPREVHAARPTDGETRRDLPQLLRDRLAVLPVARIDLHGPLPARHPDLPERRRRRRLQQVQEAR